MLMLTLANTLSGQSEGADFVIQDKWAIVDRVTSGTIIVGQSCGGQGLKIVGRWSSGDCGSTPSSDDSIDTTSSEWACKTDCSNVGVENERICYSNNSNTAIVEILVAVLHEIQQQKLTHEKSIEGCMINEDGLCYSGERQSVHWGGVIQRERRRQFGRDWRCNEQQSKQNGWRWSILRRSGSLLLFGEKPDMGTVQQRR